jgi:putative NADPH-quinone reductase
MTSATRPDDLRRSRGRILVINGHPDGRAERLCAALAEAYVRGAQLAGREVRRLDLGRMSFPLIGSADEFTYGPPPPVIAAAQASITWCDHLVLIFPLWLGGAPALLKAFLEQTFRYGFALPRPGESRGWPQGLLKGRSARLVVTMGMPAFFYRLAFGAFGVRHIEASILRLAGFSPVRRLLVGGVGELTAQKAANLLAQVEVMGSTAG